MSVMNLIIESIFLFEFVQNKFSTISDFTSFAVEVEIIDVEVD